MECTMRFFATFREVVGQKTVVREYDDVSTVGDVLEEVKAEYPELELYDDDGQVPEFVSIMKDGRDIAHIDGPETELEDGDTVSLFPPVAGG